MKFNPTESDLFFSKKDPHDIRLGDLAQKSSFEHLKYQPKKLFIYGYPDHEGIQLNGGRTGAALAPNSIRKYLYKMTPPRNLSTEPMLAMMDLGNLSTSEFELARRHELGKSTVKEILQHKHFFLSFGGGHDYGYPDAAGFCQHFIKQGHRPLVINFDAHMDVRPTNLGLNSGTPFFRLLNEFENEFDFVELGIQPQCNSIHHIEWAEKKGAKVISYSPDANYLSRLQQILATKKGQPLFISLDIDVFAQADAPGCSQSWATGMSVSDFFKTFEWLMNHFSVPGLGIYEVSPPLDQDDRTSKLAALISYHFWKNLK